MDDSDTMMAYMQGRLDTAQTADFEGKLSRSPALRAELAALRAAAEAMRADAAAAPDAARGWDRLAQAIDAETRGVPANRNSRPSWGVAAGIAAAAVLVWQVAAVPFLPGRDDGFFVPASDGITDAAALRVAFAEDATLADVTELLSEMGGSISEGPSALGLFTVVFADAAARDAAEAALAARVDLVSLVSRP